MKRATPLNYPWEGIKHGQWFFVPALDLDATREFGLCRAVENKVRAKAIYGIFNGRLGVLFLCSGQPIGERRVSQAGEDDLDTHAFDQEKETGWLE